MEQQHREPLWKRILAVPCLIGVVVALCIPACFLVFLVVIFVIPLFADFVPVGRFPYTVWLLLLIFAAVLIWMIVCIIRKKYGFLAWFFALTALICIVKTIPHLDHKAHTVVPELVKTYTLDYEAPDINPDIYYKSFFVGSSPVHVFSDKLPEEIRGELQELISDRSYTWIVSSGYEIPEISWSPKEYDQSTLWPWQTGLAYLEHHSYNQTAKNVLYVYRIPFVPIDNVS